MSGLLSIRIGTDVRIGGEVPVAGGSINDAYRLDTDQGHFFLKVARNARHAPEAFAPMFMAEADGLDRLRATGSIRIPHVIAYGEEGEDSFLLMEHIATGLKDAAFWQLFGERLAALHSHTADQFGLESHNWIGSLPQLNTPHLEWDAFFVHCRLEPQVKMAADRQRIGMGDVLRFERLYARLPGLFPTEGPALLHGDLWSGNFLCDTNGKPVLVDPAVYYGHREMDIAMTRLFGGSEPVFYTAYQAERPLEQGWEARVELCNLYPLLVHVNLFGGGYVAQLQQVLKRYA